MLIERNGSGSVTAFQQVKTDDKKKVGFICEAHSMADAISGVVELVAMHCTVTGQHPGNIIQKVNVK